MTAFQLTGGWIEVIAGVMFSGKSEELIRRVRRAIIARKRVQVFKSHLDARYAGILLEVMKDLLYQAYVRRGKLQQAMMVRRFFVEENARSKVTPLKVSS